MGVTDVLTAQYFCDLIGISTVETSSIRKSNSLEGNIEEFGQKNISTLRRNLLNVDEILRIPSTKLLINIRGNKPLLLDKIMYKNHALSKHLKDSLILEYNPKWNENIVEKNIEKQEKVEKVEKIRKNKKKITWENF